MGHNVNPKEKTNPGKPRILAPHSTSQFETPAHTSRNSPAQVSFSMPMLTTDTNPVLSLTLLRLSQEKSSKNVILHKSIRMKRNPQENRVTENQGVGW